MRDTTDWHKTDIGNISVWWIDGTERGTRCVASILDPERDADAVRLTDFDDVETRPIDPDDDPSPPRGLICYGWSKWDRPTFDRFRDLAERGHAGGYFGKYAHLLTEIDARQAAGEELREKRKRLGLTQQQLGDALGVARGTINRWESGALAIENPRMLGLAVNAIAKRLKKVRAEQ